MTTSVGFPLNNNLSNSIQPGGNNLWKHPLETIFGDREIPLQKRSNPNFLKETGLLISLFDRTTAPPLTLITQRLLTFGSLFDKLFPWERNPNMEHEFTQLKINRGMLEETPPLAPPRLLTYTERKIVFQIRRYEKGFTLENDFWKTPKGRLIAFELTQELAAEAKVTVNVQRTASAMVV